MMNLERAVIESKNNDSLYGVVLFDIDNFKTYNDEFGHDFGDEVLVDFVKNCKNLMRAGDLFARYGGDEFILLARLKTKEELVYLINRVTTYFEETPLTENRINIGFSIGIGYIDTNTSVSVIDLIDQIDKELYHQKSNKVK